MRLIMLFVSPQIVQWFIVEQAVEYVSAPCELFRLVVTAGCMSPRLIALTLPVFQHPSARFDQLVVEGVDIVEIIHPETDHAVNHRKDNQRRFSRGDIAYGTVALASDDCAFKDIDKTVVNCLEDVPAFEVGFCQFVGVALMEDGEEIFSGFGHVEVKRDGFFNHVETRFFGFNFSVPFKLGQDVIFQVPQDGEKDLLLILKMIEYGAFRRAGHLGEFTHGGIFVSFPCKQKSGGLENGVFFGHGFLLKKLD
jgi:hypothetical protein